MMERESFTPGPWAIGRMTCSYVPIKSACGQIAHTGAVKNLIPRDVMLANAQLMAAAPDMFQTLECAKLAVERLDIGAMGWADEPHEMLGKNVVPMRDELLALINNALSKARGEPA